jgi:hypothetical protein
MWADTAYRSAKNEEMLARRGFVSRIHRKKPKGKPMPERMRLANAQKSKVRSAVEHVFTRQKGLMGFSCARSGSVERELRSDSPILPTTCADSSGCGIDARPDERGSAGTIPSLQAAARLNGPKSPL